MCSPNNLRVDLQKIIKQQKAYTCSQKCTRASESQHLKPIHHHRVTTTYMLWVALHWYMPYVCHLICINLCNKHTLMYIRV